MVFEYSYLFIIKEDATYLTTRDWIEDEKENILQNIEQWEYVGILTYCRLRYFFLRKIHHKMIHLFSWMTSLSKYNHFVVFVNRKGNSVGQEIASTPHPSSFTKVDECSTVDTSYFVRFICCCWCLGCCHFPTRLVLVLAGWLG